MKNILIKIGKILGAFLAVLAFYLLCCFLIPKIPVSAEKTADPKVVDVYLYTNGVHTDIVVPIKNQYYDWSQSISFENTVSKRTDFNYVGIGWGDKGFYLDTPTWAELKPSTAFKAAFWLSESAMHCTFYNKMTVADDCVKVTLTEKQYKDLVQFINDKFDRDASGKFEFIATDAVYDKNDAFYNAKGSYNLFYTCNSWANDALKVSGQKAALWSPTDFGIFQHYQ